MTMRALFDHIKTRPCPKCGKVGGMDVLDKQFVVFCRACQTRNLNPVAIGPWDKTERAWDRYDGNLVSAYRVPKAETVQELELDDAWAGFMKHLFAGASKRDYKVKEETHVDDSGATDGSVAETTAERGGHSLG